MSYKYRTLHKSYSDLPVTDPGQDKQPIYRRVLNEAGEPILVVDHYISQQEMIESDRPEDIRTIVNRALRADPYFWADPSKVIGDSSDAVYADVSHLGDIGDVVDSALAYQVIQNAQISQTVGDISSQNAVNSTEGEVNSNES